MMLRALVAFTCLYSTANVISQSPSETGPSQLYDRLIFPLTEEEAEISRHGPGVEYDPMDGFSNGPIQNDLQKRLEQLSLNQDLTTLARSFDAQQVRRNSASRNRLRNIGKRSSAMFMFFPRYMWKYHAKRYPIVKLPKEGPRRGRRRLSMSGALSAIADMVETQSRRRLREEMAVSKASLLGIGKRSTNQRQYLSQSTEDSENETLD